MAAGGRAFSAVALVSLMILASFSGCLEEVFGEGGIEGVLGLTGQKAIDGQDNSKSLAQSGNTASQAKASSNTNAKGTAKAPAEQPKELETLVYKPGSYSVSALDLQGKTRIVLSEADYESLPVLAPAFKNHGINASIAWNKGDGVEIAAEDASKFSSQAAITFWEGKAQKAIVVDSYENALLAGPLAAILDAPILYYGSTTNEALWRTGANDSSEIIAVGNVPYADKVQVSLQSQEQVWDYTITAAKENMLAVDYVVLTNALDDETLNTKSTESGVSNPYTPHMSCIASMYAAAHNALVVCTPAFDPTNLSSASKVDAKLKSAISKMNDSGYEVKYLLIVGDSVSVPFFYKWHQATADSATGSGKIFGASDRPYADMDDNPYTSEICSGRIVGIDLQDVSKTFDRIINYNEYTKRGSQTAAMVPSPTGEWKDNSLVYSGPVGGVQMNGHTFELMLTQTWLSQDFNVENGAIQATGTGYAWPTPTGFLLAAEFAKCNFISAAVDHGSPSSTEAINAADIVDMGPSVIFMASCMVGEIDNNVNGSEDEFYLVQGKDCFVYELLKHGAVAYIAGTRSVVGTLAGAELALLALDGSVDSASSYNLKFWEELANDITVGEAFLNASNWASNGEESHNVWVYTLYGDPALNPYEPCNEGAQ
ncbi:MAG: C25 family cysteine peptidase [Candidatus Thermoplasmatota archaeon]|nr:C25 family cysteine peptidase [Candidatus Thermoplasmatota archaeon]